MSIKILFMNGVKNIIYSDISEAELLAIIGYLNKYIRNSTDISKQELIDLETISKGSYAFIANILSRESLLVPVVRDCMYRQVHILFF